MYTRPGQLPATLRALYTESIAFPSQNYEEDDFDTVSYVHTDPIDQSIDQPHITDGGSRLQRQRLQRNRTINQSVNQPTRPVFTSVFDTTYQFASHGSIFDADYEHESQPSQLFNQSQSINQSQSANQLEQSVNGFRDLQQPQSQQASYAPHDQYPPATQSIYEQPNGTVSPTVSQSNNQSNNQTNNQSNNRSVKPEPPAKQRLSSAALVSDDDFFWSNAIETPLGKIQVERNKHSNQTANQAIRQKREAKERALMTDVAESKSRSRKQPPPGFKEFNLMSLKPNLNKQSNKQTKSNNRSNTGGLSHIIEKEVKKERFTQAEIAEIEDVDMKPIVTKSEHEQSNKQSNKQSNNQSWKESLDAELDHVPILPRSDDVGTRRKIHGDLEQKLDLAKRRRDNTVSTHRHQMQQQQLLTVTQSNNQSSNQPINQSITQIVNEKGETVSVTVKVIDLVQQFSQLFLICMICSPYRPPNHQPIIQTNDQSTNQSNNQSNNQSSVGLFSSLESYASRLKVPLSSLAILAFSPKHRSFAHLQSQSDQSFNQSINQPINQAMKSNIVNNYYRMFYPWVDISRHMNASSLIITDILDFMHIPLDIGSEDEREERERLTRLDGSKESSMSEDEPFPEFEEHKEFGDLAEDQIIDLFHAPEDREMRDLQKLLSITPTPSQSINRSINETIPLSSYKRPSLASLKYYSSLTNSCVAGVIQRVMLNGHSLKESENRLSYSHPASMLVDDGTAVVQIDIPTSCLVAWRDVLSTGVGSIIWMGGLSVSDRNSIDTCERIGSYSMAQTYNDNKPILILQAMSSSRFRTQKRSSDPQTIFSNVKPHSLSFTSLSDALNVAVSTRIHVCARVIHAVFDANDSAVVWLTDASLLPLSTSVRAPCSTSSIRVLMQSHIHIQLLRSFLHWDDDTSRCVVIRDLHVQFDHDDDDFRALPEFVMDDFTDLSLAICDVNDDIIERRDPFGSDDEMLSLARTHVPSDSPIFTLRSAMLPLSSVLSRPANDDPSAAPLLLQHGVFLVEGIILDVVDDFERCMICYNCGHEGTWYDLREARPSIRSAISTFCYRCLKVNVMQISGRVSVEMKNLDLVQTFRVKLPPSIVHSLLPTSAFADVIPSHNQLVDVLKTKRISFVACAQHPILSRAVKLQQLCIVGLVPWIDSRIV